MREMEKWIGRLSVTGMGLPLRCLDLILKASRMLTKDFSRNNKRKNGEKQLRKRDRERLKFKKYTLGLN